MQWMTGSRTKPSLLPSFVGYVSALSFLQVQAGQPERPKTLDFDNCVFCFRYKVSGLIHNTRLLPTAVVCGQNHEAADRKSCLMDIYAHMFLAYALELHSQLIYSTAHTVRCGWPVQIQTSIQHAVSMVHPYPFLMDATRQLEALARQHKEPSIQTLMEPGGVDDLQHAANWETVVKYVQTFEAGNLHCHHPFLKDHAN